MQTFFTSPAAVEGKDSSAKMLQRAAGPHGMQAPDAWAPDNEDTTAPSMRDEGAESIVEVISEQSAEFLDEIHPRIAWHRDSPETRYRDFQHMLDVTDPERGMVEHIRGFVIPEVGGIGGWKKTGEFLTIVEHEYGLDEGSLVMSVIVKSGKAELTMGDLYDGMGRPTNDLEQLFPLVDGEIGYTKDMRAMTPTGESPTWPEFRHNTSRGASAVGCVVVDGPYDDICDMEGYREHMTSNQAKGMLGTWSPMPGQIVEASTSPLPPRTDSWLLDADGEEVELALEDGVGVYDSDRLSLEATDGGYGLRAGDDARELTADELRKGPLDLTSYVPSMDDTVDSMEKFETAKEAGRGAIAMAQSTTPRTGGTEIDIEKDWMWDEAAYQAAMTPISLFQDVHENRPSQHEEPKERHGAGVTERMTEVGL